MSKPPKTHDDESPECVDFNISIPCELADRVRIFANDRNGTLTSVVIEALDAFLRRRSP